VVRGGPPYVLRTGTTRETPRADQVTEFGRINGMHAGRRHRYTWSVLLRPGWFLFDGLVRLDGVTGSVESYRFGAGIYGSER
jgi:carotenoid cleavage dioxygenase